MVISQERSAMWKRISGIAGWFLRIRFGSRSLGNAVRIAPVLKNKVGAAIQEFARPSAGGLNQLVGIEHVKRANDGAEAGAGDKGNVDQLRPAESGAFF